MPDGDGERELFYRAPSPRPEYGDSSSVKDYDTGGLKFSEGCEKVSVVIPTYHRPQMLYRVLHTICAQHDPNYEVLVSNDDDPDRSHLTSDVIREFKSEGMPIAEYRTGQYKRGRGWSVETYPYNVGIRKAMGEIVMLNSGDVMSVTGTIAQHRAAHISNPNLVVFSTVHALTPDFQKEIDTRPWKSSPTSLLFRGSCQKMYSGRGKSYTLAYSVEDACVPYHFQCSVRRGHLHEIRGFDEDFYGMMPCGDDDLAYRLKKKGLSFIWDPHIIAIHQCHGDPDTLSGGVSSESNPVIGGHALYARRQSQSVVRNTGGEWGEYPRKV